MKKTLLSMALFGAVGVAVAEPSVTVYGTLDAGVAYDNGSPAGSVTKLESGMESGSRLGFKGTEDLGSGLKALFVLEQGLAVDTGTSLQGGRLFGRQAFVGLGGNLGTVTMGRQYTPIYNAYGVIDPFGTNTAGDINTLFGRDANFLSRDFRMDNAVVYTAPTNLNGFNATFAYGFGEQAGDMAAQRQTGMSLGYAEGPIKAIYAYHAANTDMPPVYGDTYKSHFFGASYDVNIVKIHAAFDQTTQGNQHKTQSYLLGVSVPMGANSVFADYTYRENKLVSDANASQIAAGYNYTLSKRTNLYAVAAYTLNDGHSAVNTPMDNPDWGKSVTKVQLGIRHTF